MNKSILVLALILLSTVCYAQKVEIIKFDKLDNLIHQKKENLIIINFWATWCGPCIKELPYFESLNSKPGNDLEVYLISVDFASKIEKVNSFVKKKGLKSKVYLLDEIDYNSWIDRVDSIWSGAIPATLIINSSTSQRKFIEGELKPGELENYIKEISN